jgi:hypothetical protein
VLLAIDDSLSMRHFKAEEVALTALATLASGMSTLEIGELGVAAFGQSLRVRDITLRGVLGCACGRVRGGGKGGKGGGRCQPWLDNVGRRSLGSP